MCCGVCTVVFLATRGCRAGFHWCIWRGKQKRQQQQLISLALSMALLSAAFHFAPNELPDEASESDEGPPDSRVCALGACGSVIRCSC